jgi:pyrroloquinoline-quinone synthase
MQPSFLDSLHQALEPWSLLKHPFYQAWSAGQLSPDTLTLYATEYYHHVAAFPRYISQVHALCAGRPGDGTAGLGDRQVLLENLNDEEQGPDNHPELWMRFVEALCQARVRTPGPELPSTQRLIEGFLGLAKTDYPTGLGALYAYERQTPSVAQSKLEGLKEHYGIDDPRGVSFFAVHASMDEKHTADLVGLIEKLDDADLHKVADGALRSAQLLWGFLDGVWEATQGALQAVSSAKTGTVPCLHSP